VPFSVLEHCGCATISGRMRYATGRLKFRCLPCQGGAFESYFDMSAVGLGAMMLPNGRPPVQTLCLGLEIFTRTRVAGADPSNATCPQSRSLSHILAVLNTSKKVVKIISIHWTYLMRIPILDNLDILLSPQTSQH
jgi:hypothetical protein